MRIHARGSGVSRFDVGRRNDAGSPQADRRAYHGDCFNPRPRAGSDKSVAGECLAAPRFNPRPRAGGDSRHRHFFLGIGVSIHAPARGATNSRRSRSHDKRSFNPRPRAGGDRRYDQNADPSPISTPPRGGRQGMTSCVSGVRAGFNPRPRAGGDAVGRPEEHYGPVSIHAPARGATVWLPAGDRLTVVSIHAPARGATAWWHGSTTTPARFNPRPRAGGDPRRRCRSSPASRFQSTPPRGGRPYQLAPIQDPIGRFNPRPRAGGDCCSPTGPSCACPFQSTPPRGGRHRVVRVRPRARDVSIHAPARGATPRRPSTSSGA